jgi:hypothetical protein
MSLSPLYRTAIGLIIGSLIAGSAFAEDAAPDGAVTKSLQGGGPGSPQQALIDNPNMRAFFDLSVAAFAQGPDKVDVDGFEAKSFTIFRALGVSMGTDPERFVDKRFVDNMKLIPRQVVQIAREDPKMLASYRNFIVALLGPD